MTCKNRPTALPGQDFPEAGRIRDGLSEYTIPAFKYKNDHLVRMAAY